MLRLNHGVIKFLRQNKGYSARRFVKEFLLKNWKIGGLNKLLKKIGDTRSTARLAGILCLPVKE